MAKRPRLAFIGMGEAGSSIVSGWGGGVARTIRAYDIKTDQAGSAGEMDAHYTLLGITGCCSSAEAVRDAEIVFSTVTADQAVVAAEVAAPHLPPGAFWCDLNSCAPSSKRKAAETIGRAGGRYVDVAVMSPVHPQRNMVPLLIAGPNASAVEPLLASLPMAPRIMPGEIGAASSVKMIRSVMVKGLEAVTAECLFAAAAAGVADEVLASLSQSHADDWAARAAYNLERMLVHGERRATEMEEVVKTLIDLGLFDDMARATVDWQRRVGKAGRDAPFEKSSSAQALARQFLPLLPG